MTRVVFFLLFLILDVTNLQAQERKLKKIRELLAEQKKIEATELISELSGKYSNYPPVLYYDAVVDFQNGISLDSVYLKVKNCKRSVVNTRYLNNKSDSTELGFTIQELHRLKAEVENLAFDKFYKFSKSIDSLVLFKTKFEANSNQIKYISDRTCELTSIIVLQSEDRQILKNFISNFEDCSQLNLVKLRLLRIDWTAAKTFNTYKSYELFELEYPKSIFEDSVKMAIELLDWERTLFTDSMSNYTLFMSKYPHSRYLTQAKNKIDSLIWFPISNTGTKDQLRGFISQFPNSRYVNDARDSLIRLSWFEIALTNDLISVNNFLIEFPNSKYENQALKRQDALMWNTVSQNSEESINDYLNHCNQCDFKESAYEKLSVLLWEKIRTSNDTSVLNNFLYQFPNSTLRDVASKKKNALAKEANKVSCTEKETPDSGGLPLFTKTCLYRTFKTIVKGYPDYKGRYSYTYSLYKKDVTGGYIQIKNAMLFNENKNELLSIVNAKIEKDYMSFYNDPESRDCFDGASFMPYTIDQLGIEFSTYGINFNVAFGLSGACMSVDGTKVSFNFDEIRKYLKE
jgi:hypothetical protein